jgi:hypothetical protein
VSNRVDVRRASARAERALLAGAEPLSALFLPPGRWPGALLDEAWRAVIRNSAHDSVCACSIDDVCDAVLVRYSEAADIADGLATRAAAALAARVDHEGPVVVNPTARPRGGMVQVVVPGTEAPPGTQLVRAQRGRAVLHAGPPAIVVPAAQEVDWVPTISAFAVEDEAGTVLVANERRGTAGLVSAEVRAALDGLRTGHEGDLRLVVRQPEQVTVLAHVADVPGFGWRGWAPGDVSQATPVTVTSEDLPVLANGLVAVAVAADGTFALDGHAGLGRLVDGGDCGDTYNWCPPTEDTLVDRPIHVDVAVVERGPVRARVVITARFRWPTRRERLARRSDAIVEHEVRTVLELRAGEPAVRVEVRLDNAARDHRLRAHFPLPSPATASRAECAYGTVERGLQAEGGPTEAPLATYPAQRFVQAGGLTVVHDGVTEYELVGLDGDPAAARELALTLLRSSGMLSQVPMATRPLPAGPLIPLAGAQLQGPVTRSYAVAVGDVDPFALADEVLVPLRVTDGGSGGGELAATGTALTVTGAEVAAVVREGEALVVRVLNPTDRETTVGIDGRQGWLVDLRGRPQEPFDGSFSLRARGIATAMLSPG